MSAEEEEVGISAGVVGPSDNRSGRLGSVAPVDRHAEIARRTGVGTGDEVEIFPTGVEDRIARVAQTVGNPSGCRPLKIVDEHGVQPVLDRATVGDPARIGRPGEWRPLSELRTQRIRIDARRLAGCHIGVPQLAA